MAIFKKKRGKKVKPEVKEEVKPEIKSEVKEEVKEEVKPEIKEEVPVLSPELPPEMRAEILSVIKERIAKWDWNMYYELVLDGARANNYPCWHFHYCNVSLVKYFQEKDIKFITFFTVAFPESAGADRRGIVYMDFSYSPSVWHSVTREKLLSDHEMKLTPENIIYKQLSIDDSKLPKAFRKTEVEKVAAISDEPIKYKMRPEWVHTKYLITNWDHGRFSKDKTVNILPDGSVQE